MSNQFDAQLTANALEPLAAVTVDTLQVNLGKLCNQACRHCHVDAGPHQTAAEVNMSKATASHVIRVLESTEVQTLDLTGGAPELNPNFRKLVSAASAMGTSVMDRCNLSVLFEPGQEDLTDFLVTHRVEVVASLPFYRKDRTDRQRGAGVFDASIEGLRRLNSRGYGQDPELRLNLVFNPVGAYLPGDQQGLEAEYKRELAAEFDIRFDRLFCITNMPIARYREWLLKSGNFDSYMQTLVQAFNPHAVEGVMCRNLISVAPDGTLHDCDFNQMLGMELHETAPRNIRDFDLQKLQTRAVVTDDHCLGCTAGAGSSCGGSVA